jgi:hypothetical protein
MHRAIRIAFFFALDYCILYAAINKGQLLRDLGHERNSPMLTHSVQPERTHAVA